MNAEIVNENELDAFQRFVDEKWRGSLNGHTLGEAIAEFRQYQQELSALQARLKQSEQSAQREGARPLTEERLSTLCDKWEAELRQEGFAE